MRKERKIDLKIDFSEIVNAKLKKMADDKVIEKQIEQSIETTITKAVKDACEDYSFKREIEKKVEEQVNEAVNKIGFTGYNQYIADVFSELIGTTLKEDVKQKILDVFDNIFIKKLETVKMSEIADKYRETLLEMEDSEKYDHDNAFYVSFDEDKDDGNFKWLTIHFALEKPSGRYSDDENYLEMRIMSYKNEPCSISSVRYEGRDLSKLNELRHMSDFESFIASLYFNKTKIEMDIGEDDVDTSLGLDY